MYHNIGSLTDVCQITPSPIRLLTRSDSIRLISSLRLEATNRLVVRCIHFVTMTIKRESSTPFGSSTDKELQAEYDSHTPSEGEVQNVQEVQEHRSRVPRSMDESRRAPNPFPERGAADMLAALDPIQR